MVPTELASNPGCVPAPMTEGLGAHTHGASILPSASRAVNGTRQEEMAEPKLPGGKGHGGRK